MRTDARLLVTGTDGGAREVALYTYLDAALTERAEEEANRWVKALRALQSTDTAQDRFTTAVIRSGGLRSSTCTRTPPSCASTGDPGAGALIERERPAALR